jgi:hypothetical protein
VLDTFLGYDPTLDRLIGGDQIRQIQGRWAKISLLPLARAQDLFPLMKAFGEAWQQGRPAPISGEEPPYPLPLAAIQLGEFPARVDRRETMVLIPELFTAEELSAAPLEHLQLGQLVALIPSPRTLQQEQPSGAGLDAFSRRLFSLVRCAHRDLAATLTRGMGCCLHPELLTPQGELNDLYFLTSAGELTPEGYDLSVRNDLMAAIALLTTLAPSPAIFAELVKQAVETYAGRGVGVSVVHFAVATAHEVAGTALRTPERRRKLSALVDGLRTATL